MGGKLLEKHGARRYAKNEYTSLVSRILGELSNLLPTFIFKEIPSYHSKESFGDADILTTPLTPAMYRDIMQTLKVEHYHKNGNVLSMLVEQLQVDLISVPDSDFDSALHYYSYNDLGNLLGKLYRSLGLKFGHRGLTYPVRDKTHQYGEIIVSKDFPKILEFLGLDYKTFEQGFSDLPEIFEFVCSSKYFSPIPFQLENLNAVDRIRDKKRSTYMAFLKYVADKQSTYNPDPNKANYLPLILDFFPGIQEPYNLLVEEHKRRLYIRTLFNGSLVEEWTEYHNVHLGYFMKFLRETLGNPETWVLNLTPEQIKDLVLTQAQLYKEHLEKRLPTVHDPDRDNGISSDNIVLPNCSNE